MRPANVAVIPFLRRPAFSQRPKPPKATRMPGRSGLSRHLCLRAGPSLLPVTTRRIQLNCYAQFLTQRRAAPLLSRTCSMVIGRLG
jgi:hypothetical protein